MAEHGSSKIDKDRNPTDNYGVVKATLEQKLVAEDTARRQFMDVMRQMTDEELVGLAVSLGTDEPFMQGGQNLVAKHVIVDENILAQIIAERHLGSEPHHAAVLSLASYFRDLWIGRTNPEYTSPETALERARDAMASSLAAAAIKAETIEDTFGKD